MKQMFDYFEYITSSVTVCDKNGVVVYQNKVAVLRDGNSVGKSLFNCHKPQSNEKIKRMIEAGVSNTYETIKDGKRHLVHHTPWRNEENGEVAGLIEFEIDMPETHPVYNRDLK